MKDDEWKSSSEMPESEKEKVYRAYRGRIRRNIAGIALFVACGITSALLSGFGLAGFSRRDWWLSLGFGALAAILCFELAKTFKAQKCAKNGEFVWREDVAYAVSTSRLFPSSGRSYDIYVVKIISNEVRKDNTISVPRNS